MADLNSAPAPKAVWFWDSYLPPLSSSELCSMLRVTLPLGAGPGQPPGPQVPMLGDGGPRGWQPRGGPSFRNLWQLPHINTAAGEEGRETRCLELLCIVSGHWPVCWKLLRNLPALGLCWHRGGHTTHLPRGWAGQGVTKPTWPGGKRGRV